MSEPSEAPSPLGSALNNGKSEDPVSELSYSCSLDGLNGGGLAAIIVFYFVVLLVGMAAGWKRRKHGTNQEEVMLAGRDIGIFVGVLTMGATWVGGGFINGSAEEAYKSGLIWVQAPFGYSIALILAGTFFAKKMRDSRYVTMIDPFTQKYGKWGAIQAFPAAISEIFWSASILGSLGSTLEVILNLDTKVSIIVSAVIALLYTLLGGLISVAYTDVVQIFFVVFGMFLALPFAINHEAVSNIYDEKLPEDGTTPAWYGRVPTYEWGYWVDIAFLCMLGGIPWQCYFQRVLSTKTSMRAVLLSYGGAAIALIMTGPSVLFGAIGKATDWSQTDYNCTEIKSKVILPLALQYLTPPVVAFFGLGAVSAAVMSSTDSSLLSASTMLARNFYQKVLRPHCSEREVIYALWVLICINCIISSTLAIKYESTYELFVLCGDFMFVLLFPQLTLVLYYEMSNTYGSVISFIVGLVLRLLCGDSSLKLPATITFGTIYGEPGSCPEENEPLKACEGPVPFRTIICLIGFIVHTSLSFLAHYLFTREIVPLKFDFFNSFRYDTNQKKVVPRNSRHLLTEELQMKEMNGH